MKRWTSVTTLVLGLLLSIITSYAMAGVLTAKDNATGLSFIEVDVSCSPIDPVPGSTNAPIHITADGRRAVLIPDSMRPTYDKLRAEMASMGFIPTLTMNQAALQQLLDQNAGRIPATRGAQARVTTYDTHVVDFAVCEDGLPHIYRIDGNKAVSINVDVYSFTASILNAGEVKGSSEKIFSMFTLKTYAVTKLYRGKASCAVSDADPTDVVELTDLWLSHWPGRLTATAFLRSGIIEGCTIGDQARCAYSFKGQCPFAFQSPVKLSVSGVERIGSILIMPLRVDGKWVSPARVIVEMFVPQPPSDIDPVKIVPADTDIFSQRELDAANSGRSSSGPWKMVKASPEVLARIVTLPKVPE